MEPNGPACIEALDGAEEGGTREGAEGSAGGVLVEREVGPVCRQLTWWLFEYKTKQDAGQKELNQGEASVVNEPCAEVMNLGLCCEC